jgi:hypothetical protein
MLDFPEQTTDARRQDDGTRKKKEFNNGKLSEPWNPKILESTCRTVAHDVVLLTQQIYLYVYFFSILKNRQIE